MFSLDAPGEEKKFFFGVEEENASHRTRNIQKASVSDGKLHCFHRNNTEIRINISFLSASTLIRECVSLAFFFAQASFRWLFDIPKLKAIAVFRSGVLPSKKKNETRRRKSFPPCSETGSSLMLVRHYSSNFDLLERLPYQRLNLKSFFVQLLSQNQFIKTIITRRPRLDRTHKTSRRGTFWLKSVA